ncbi:MAG TPA: DinB family protein [Cytophagales bacterium]|nr:DinB family protein [Cytophagales bacterium]
MGSAIHMYDYHTWAMSKTLQHMQHLYKDIHNTSLHCIFPSILNKVKQIYIVDHSWLDTLHGKSSFDVASQTQRVIKETQHDDAEIIEAKMLKLSEEFRQILKEDMNRKILFMNTELNYMDIVQHMANHGTYRRGQITSMLKQAGHNNTQTDYLLYLYLVNREHEELNTL